MEWKDIKVRILGLSATPIKDGNCDTLIRECLKKTKELGEVETDFVTLADKKIEVCKHCQWCIENMSPCKIKDDAQEIWGKMREADGLIVGTPAWYQTLSPFIPILFSRLRYYTFFTHDFRNQPVAALTLGYLGYGLDNAITSLKVIFTANNMLPVSEGKVVTSTRVFGQRPAYLEHGVLDDTWGLKQAQAAAIKVVELARIIKFATEAGVVAPEEYRFTVTGARVVPKEKTTLREGVRRRI